MIHQPYASMPYILS